MVWRPGGRQPEQKAERPHLQPLAESNESELEVDQSCELSNCTPMKTSDPLELQIILRYCVGAGNEPSCSARAVSALNCSVSVHSPARAHHLSNKYYQLKTKCSST